MNNLLENSRDKIDAIDKELIKLFTERMNVVKEVAEYKKANNMPVFNAARERSIIANLTENMDDQFAEYTKMLYLSIFDISRSYQELSIQGESDLLNFVQNSIENSPLEFPKQATVACQGTEGANSSIACDKLFSRSNIMYMNTFGAVFKAVEQGLCKYGILPIENSLHGSVTQVYDLMKKHNFQIARSARVKIDHALLVKPGTRLEDVKEIYSHPQALAQCSEYLKNFPNAEIKEYENTALAAEMVSQSDRNDIAAVASLNCTELYNLVSLKSYIQNRDNNYTRFICISKKPEIYKDADKISLMFTVPHKPGSLYRILSKFSSLGINMSKLESRPMPERDFEFVFYVDFEANISDPVIQKLLIQLENSSETFSYLGSYREV